MVARPYDGPCAGTPAPSSCWDVASARQAPRRPHSRRCSRNSSLPRTHCPMRSPISTPTATWTLPSHSTTGRSGSIAMTRASFVEAGAALGLPIAGAEVRGLSWGDFDGDGDPDLHAGVSGEQGLPARNLLFRNDGGAAFVEVAEKAGLRCSGAPTAGRRAGSTTTTMATSTCSRRSDPAANRMFRNDDATFTDVSAEVGLDDPRRTVGACWFDMDQDGDLDVFLANQQADKDALYRNDGGRFADVAPELGMHQPERTLDGGRRRLRRGRLRQRWTARPFRRDVWHDAALSESGRGKIPRSRRRGWRAKAAPCSGCLLGRRGQRRPPRPLRRGLRGWRRVVFTRSPVHEPGAVSPTCSRQDSPLHASDHGVQWADFDRDGDLDLSLAEDFPDGGRHTLFRNQLPVQQGRSLAPGRGPRSGRSRDASGRGSAVVLSRRQLLGTRLVPTGDGYGSQGIGPVHFGLADDGTVTVEVTFLTREGRVRKRRAGGRPAHAGGRCAHRASGLIPLSGPKARAGIRAISGIRRGRAVRPADRPSANVRS